MNFFAIQLMDHFPEFTRKIQPCDAANRWPGVQPRSTYENTFIAIHARFRQRCLILLSLDLIWLINREMQF